MAEYPAAASALSVQPQAAQAQAFSGAQDARTPASVQSGRRLNRQDSARLHGRRGGRSVAERAVLGVRRISRLPAGVQRRRGSWKIGPADREGEWLAARGHEAGGDQRVKYHGDQQNAGHELAPAAIEESRAHVLQIRAAALFWSLSVQTRARQSRAPYRELLHYPTAAYPARSMRSPRNERSVFPPLCQSIG